MAAGFILFRIGILVSITYFIVIPIIPDKNDANIVRDIKIPVLVFSLDFRTVEIAIPSVRPAKDPAIRSKNTKKVLLP